MVPEDLNGAVSPDDERDRRPTAFVPMQVGHAAFLASDRWAEMLHTDLLPWLTAHGDLGELFAEMCRVLAPAGVFLVADAVDDHGIRERHDDEGETFTPLDPTTLADRLRQAGFTASTVEEHSYQLLVRARKTR